MVIYLIWGAWFLAWLATVLVGQRQRGALHGARSALFHLVAAAAWLLLLNIASPFPAIDLRYRLWATGVPDGIGWVLVALALVAFGFSLWASAYRILKLQHGARIVDRGPYAVVRHPLHLGVIFAAALTAVLFGEPTALSGAILLSAALVVKAWAEERANDNAAHRAYRRRVPMLMPFWPTSE
jgi:protein-S-isoprenylcysteine O-methyltransferase Ste14